MDLMCRLLLHMDKLMFDFQPPVVDRESFSSEALCDRQPVNMETNNSSEYSPPLLRNQHLAKSGYNGPKIYTINSSV